MVRVQEEELKIEVPAARLAFLFYTIFGREACPERSTAELREVQEEELRSQSFDWLFLVMGYDYILHSKPHDKYYVGSSTDPWRRLIEHNSTDRITFTSKYRLWELAVVFQVVEGPFSAIYLERYIKRQKSKRLLNKLIDSDYVPVGDLAQLVRVPHVRD